MQLTTPQLEFLLRSTAQWKTEKGLAIREAAKSDLARQRKAAAKLEKQRDRLSKDEKQSIDNFLTAKGAFACPPGKAGAGFERAEPKVSRTDLGEASTADLLKMLGLSQ